MTPPNAAAPPTPQPKRTRLFALAALGVAALAFVLMTAGGIGRNLVYYWSPKELRAAGDKAYGATIRLGGLVAPGSIVFAKDSSQLEFDVTDGSASVRVKSQGVPPQMFRERIGVVVEGTLVRAGHFESQRLMVSHNNEYRAPKDGEPGETLDVKALMRSLQEAETRSGGAPPPAGMGATVPAASPTPASGMRP